jgi:hypothetical protein
VAQRTHARAGSSPSCIAAKHTEPSFLLSCFVFQTLSLVNSRLQEIAAAHAAAAHATKTVAAATGDSMSNVLHDDAFPKPEHASIFNIIQAVKSSPLKNPAATLKTHQPQLPPDYELSGLPPPTRQKTNQSPQAPAPMSSPLLPQLAEGRHSVVGDRKVFQVKF